LEVILTGAKSMHNPSSSRRLAVVIGLAVLAFEPANSASAQSDSPLPIRGVVRALNVAAISSDLTIPIKKIVFREGETFKRGDVLVEFDCGRLLAEKSALLAERKVQSLTYRNNKTLLKHRAIGEFDVMISKAKVGKADAEIKRLDVRISQCSVAAPYDGKVDEIFVHQYETPKPGTPYIRIIATGGKELEFIVPSKWLAWLREGSKFSFTIDETGKTYHGTVSRLGASVDAVSQTIQIKGKLDNEPPEIFVGMSGSAKFDQPGS
jgi:RND family efflux transporter MFP subunit